MPLRLILASASPRRRALLEALGLHLIVITSDAPEDAEGAAVDVAIAHAVAKRDAVMRRVSLESGVWSPTQATSPPPSSKEEENQSIVIAADTVVVVDGEVLGKPRDLEEARVMVSRLSGRSHEVITGLAVGEMASGKTAEAHELTRVVFRPLAPAEIDLFVHAVRPLDRAGAYTVDGPGSLLVERYEGCFYNVLGLPLVCLDRLLRGYELSLFELMDAGRAVFL